MQRILSGKRRKLIALATAVFVITAIGIGFSVWYQHSRYITTDNARIDAALIPVVALSPGQVTSLNVGVGSYVEQGQRVAEVGQPRASTGSGMQGFRASPFSGARVEAPVSGFVAAVWVYPGAIIGQGQPIVTLYDPSNVWVTPNIEETKVWQIRPGQRVEISVDSLGGSTLQGEVEGIAPATAATFSFFPQQNISGKFTKVTQVVSIRIAIAQPDGYLLIPGTSVGVRILIK